jgi:hypothetical protein
MCAREQHVGLPASSQAVCEVHGPLLQVMKLHTHAQYEETCAMAFVLSNKGLCLRITPLALCVCQHLISSCQCAVVTTSRVLHSYS